MEPANPNIAAERGLVTELFDAALDLPVAEWDGYLDRSGAPAWVCDEVRRLLAVTDEAAEFFEKLAETIQPLLEEQPRLDAGQILNGRFRIVRFLARGGMGEVYEAEHLYLGTRVALKVMTPGAELRAVEIGRAAFESFRDEVNHSIEITHENVCRTHEVDRAVDSHGDDLFFFTMELLGGRSLSETLRESGPLTVDQARSVMAQMAAGLDAAHRVGVLHRDFKSGNVMLVPRSESGPPRVVVTDFGLARSVHPDAAHSGDDGATRAYASPEQLAGREQTPASDVFSFGVVLYEMLTGQLPFDPDSVLRSKPPVAPRKLQPGLPERWEKAILQCLEADPAKRFLSAGDVVKAMEPTPLIAPGWFAVAACLVLAFAAMFIGRTPVQPPSLAVLPFEVDAEENRYLAEGLADRVTDSLSQVPGLRVISRVASGRLKDAGKDFKRTAGQFHVRYLLLGSLKRAGPKYHVRAEIVDASLAGEPAVWSDSQDLTESGLDILISVVIRAAVQNLKLVVEPGIDAAPTKNEEAFKDYLLGRYYATRRTPESMHESVALLEKAVALDPGFAVAWSALGYSYHDLSIRSGAAWQEPARRSLWAAARAIALEPKSPMAHLTIAMNKAWWQWDWAGSEREFQAALAANRSLSDTHHQYALVLGWLGRTTEALNEISRALDLDPMSSKARVAKGTLLMYAGRATEALHEYDTVSESDPGYSNVWSPKSDADLALGRITDAVEDCEKAKELSGGQSFALSCLGRMYAEAGRLSDSRQVVAELESRLSAGNADPMDLVRPYIGMREKDAAFSWLERAFQVHSLQLSDLKGSPDYYWLRGDARYAGLVARLKL